VIVAMGYGYHPGATAAYMQQAMERRDGVRVLYTGTPWEARPGFAATGDIRQVMDDLPERPDLFLYVDSGRPRYFPRGLTTLECPTACYLIDVHIRPQELLRQAMFFDYAFSAQRDFVATLRAAGHPQAHWLPLACDPAVHRPYDVPKRYDIAFVGATGPGYERRRALLARLAQRFTLNDYTRSYTPDAMARVYSEARLVFNCALRHEVNMRVFEGPATGTALLTDRIDNGLAALMTDGAHVVLYDDDTLVARAAELLGDEAARARIAAQGYAHVQAHHTYDHRVATLLDTVFAAGGPRLAAPLRGREDTAVTLAYAALYARMGRVDDTLDQLKRLPPNPRLRLRAGAYVLSCLLRRANVLKPYG